MARSWSRLVSKLSEPMDGAAIAVFRIGFGIILLLDSIRYGWVLCLECYYLEPSFLFKYYGFEWVQPWPADGLYWHHAVLAVCAAGIALGLFYRVCIVLFTIGFGYLFLLDQARYLNHFYMVMLFCILLCFVPAHRLWSLDALRKPELASPTLPFWCKVLLAGQLEIILIYAGIAKLNWDWLNLEPLRMWLSYRADMPLVGGLFVQDWSVAVAVYGVIALHLLGAPLLFVPRIRWVVLGIYAAFHILNHFVFNIGIFPWMTLFASLLCFEPDWPRRLYRRLRGRPGSAESLTPAAVGTGAVPAHAVSRSRQQWIALMVVSWLTLQCLIPLRHHLYPGNVAWNEEGHRFSWRMKLRSKRGQADFVVVDSASGRRWSVREADFLNAKQLRKMPCQPDMVLQFAHYLESVWQAEHGLAEVEVYARIRCSLNGREPQALVDRKLDLTTLQRTLLHRDWVVPLQQPLPSPFLPAHWFGAVGE